MILLAGSWLGWIGVVLGVSGTVYANVMSGLPRGPLAATVAAWPALAFTVASFMLERWLAGQVTAVPAAVPGVPEPGTGSTGTRTRRPSCSPPTSPAGKVPGIRRIRSGLHVGQPRAEQVQAYLKTLSEASGATEASGVGHRLHSPDQ